MKRLIFAGVLSIALIGGTACSSGGSSSTQSSVASSGSAQSVQESTESTSGGGAAFQEYSELPGVAVLDSYELGLSVTYGAPANATGGGRAQQAYQSDGELWFVYDFEAVDSSVSRDANELFDLCASRIISSDATHFNYVSAAKDVNLNSANETSVNGTTAYYYSGMLSCTSGSDLLKVPFAMTAQLNNKMISWCIVMDDSADQSSSVDELESWVEKVAHTYRESEL